MKKYLSQFSHSMQSGFTLVELLVSLGLFTVIVVAAVGSLYTVNQASVKVNAMRTVLDNLNFATESMSRTIRTGENIVCNGTENTGGVSNNCAFGNANGAGYAVSLKSTIDGTSIEYMYNYGKKEIDKCTLVNNQISANSCVAITAPEVQVQKMQFFVDGADAGDSKQPSVMMLISGQANAGADNIAPFSIQTLISQRAAE
jgi:prepilin-type N-terminal cleavage/methylation domain-containing protein